MDQKKEVHTKSQLFAAGALSYFKEVCGIVGRKSVILVGSLCIIAGIVLAFFGLLNAFLGVVFHISGYDIDTIGDALIGGSLGLWADRLAYTCLAIAPIFMIVVSLDLTIEKILTRGEEVLVGKAQDNEPIEQGSELLNVEPELAETKKE